jgi:hypothetical protein
MSFLLLVYITTKEELDVPSSASFQNQNWNQPSHDFLPSSKMIRDWRDGFSLSVSKPHAKTLRKARDVFALLFQTNASLLHAVFVALLPYAPKTTSVFQIV